MKKKIAVLALTLSVLASGLYITTFPPTYPCPPVKCMTVPPPNPYY